MLLTILSGIILMSVPLGALADVAGENAVYARLRDAAALLRDRRYSAAWNRLENEEEGRQISDILMTQLYAAKARAAVGAGDYPLAMQSVAVAKGYSPDEEADDMLRLIESEICFAAGDFDRALALSDSVATPGYFALANAHKVRALTMLGRYDDAVGAATVAMVSVYHHGGGESDAMAALMQNRGYAYREMGNYAEAVKDLSGAAEMMSDPTDRLNLLGNLALAESDMGRHVDALRHVRESVAGLPAGSPDWLASRRKEGQILRKAGMKVESERVMKDYFRREKELLKRNLPEMSASERLNLWVKEKGLLSKIFSLDGDADFLYEVANFRRLTSLGGMRDGDALAALMEVDADRLRRSMAEGEAAVEIVRFEENGGDIYGAVVVPKRGRASVVKLIDEKEIYAPGNVGDNSIYNALKRESAEDKNRIYADSALSAKIWRPIFSALPEGTSRVYFAPEGVFHLWGIENMPIVNIPIGERGKKGKGCKLPELRRVTSTAQLCDRTAKSGLKAASGEVADPGNLLLIGGLDYGRLDSELNADGGKRGSGDSGASETMRGLGARARFGYLKGTRSEVDSIAALGRRGDWPLTLSHEMGEARMKSCMGEFSRVHVATHGYSLNFGVRRRPEFMADSVALDRSLAGSGLALSGANLGYLESEGEDGLLSAREICLMDLSGVDFVVMSACRTALGDISDEGAAGLVRALKMAGVKTIIATLWEVDDLSTMAFMRAFYDALGRGAGKYEAYREAQRRVREEERKIAYRPFSAATLARKREAVTRTLPAYEEPYYWAPFILIDDYR